MLKYGAPARWRDLNAGMRLPDCGDKYAERALDMPPSLILAQPEPSVGGARLIVERFNPTRGE
jgi:hypothetical protein